MMPVDVRSARLSDSPEIVAMLEAQRARYEHYQPIFWRRASGAHEKSKLYVRWHILNPRSTVIVCQRDHRIIGCLFAMRAAPPPVFDPGGPTIMVDDFCVEEDAEWETIGSALLAELQRVAERKNWHQLVTVCAEGDTVKSQFLKNAGLSIASNWSVSTFRTLTTHGRRGA